MQLPLNDPMPGERVIALVGNPNVGKSTLLGALTGLPRHTESSAGKTVASAAVMHRQRSFVLVELPGICALDENSAEQEIVAGFLNSGRADAVAVVCDATSLERSLMLAIEIMERAERVVVCVNLLDEAKRCGMEVDTEGLSRRMGVPVVGVSAETGEGLEQLMDAVELCCHPGGAVRRRLPDCGAEECAQRWAAECVRPAGWADAGQQQPDRLLARRLTGFPMVAALLGGFLCLLAAVSWRLLG